MVSFLGKIMILWGHGCYTLRSRKCPKHVSNKSSLPIIILQIQSGLIHDDGLRMGFVLSYFSSSAFNNIHFRRERGIGEYRERYDYMVFCRRIIIV